MADDENICTQVSMKYDYSFSSFIISDNNKSLWKRLPVIQAWCILKYIVIR